MNSRARRRAHRKQGRLHPSKYTAVELRTMLIEDGCKRVGPASTPNPHDGLDYMLWLVKACERIGKLQKKRVDDVFVEIENEVKARTGHGMPL
jgi:hypothetical protein